jgi:hypothetical protein
MNHPEPEIEKALRRAPKPPPPHGLKERLIRGMELPATGAKSPSVSRPSAGWLRRWWPALVPAAASLVCTVALGLQKMELQQLRSGIDALSAGAPASPAESSEVSEGSKSGVPLALTEEQEIAALQQQLGVLRAEIAQGNQLRAENEKLRAQLATPVSAPAEDDEKARDRALQIQCVNNLKQICLAARVWAGDNNDIYPPDIISMSNELNTPRILACPADPAHPRASKWAEYSPANCSYEFLAPDAPETEPTRVAFRCPVHGTIGLCDGSVQSIGKNRPELLTQRDGKLYFEPGRTQ